MGRSSLLFQSRDTGSIVTALSFLPVHVSDRVCEDDPFQQAAPRSDEPTKNEPVLDSSTRSIITVFRKGPEEGNFGGQKS